jgi:Ca2+-binding EF-hand superfamily protein
MLTKTLTNELAGQEESLDDLRAKFREADTDGSGYLTPDELALALRNMGAGVGPEDVV